PIAFDRGRGLVQHVFHLPARIPAGSPRGQIVRRAAKRKTRFVIMREIKKQARRGAFVQELQSTGNRLPAA
ncbi:MAG TPA: hypothetical protein VF772_11995, partial [Terriglobales bacterium]